MSVINRNKLQEPLPCASLLQASSNCYFQSNSNQTGNQSDSGLSSASSSTQSSASNSPANPNSSTNSNFQRRVPNVFSPRERLEAFESTDYDRLKPLLMFNLESIQTYRAD